MGTSIYGICDICKKELTPMPKKTHGKEITYYFKCTCCETQSPPPDDKDDFDKKLANAREFFKNPWESV